jgi:hypothetical protein
MGSLIHSNYEASPYASPLSPQEGVDQYLEDLNRKADIYHGQQSLAQALQAQMSGTGPNPAQTQYLSNVNNNIANAQGLIASQRGLNPALAARMGSNIAAKSNQEATLGSALLQQQQQLGATANLGNLYGQMQQGNIAALGEQNQMQGQARQINYGVDMENTKNTAGIIGGITSAGASAGAKAATGAAHGAYIGGKANVPGDSSQNDTVPAMLSPGEIVIPRSVAHDPEKAKEFIDHLLKEKDGGKKKVGYGEVLKARKKKAA